MPNLPKTVQHILTLAGSTSASRVLGLVRDVVMVSAMGTGLYTSAFLVAFTLPNLFRRLLGEGALNSAFIPVFTRTLSDATSGKSWALLNSVISRLLIITSAIALITLLFFEGLKHLSILPENWQTAIPYTQWLIHYVVLICIAAILTGALNSHSKFAVPSLSPIILNVSMITAVIIGNLILNQSTQNLAMTLCIGVLIGGALQMLLPAVQLMSMGWKPQWTPKLNEDSREVQTLFLGAGLGAAVVQLNHLISRILAYQVSDDAVSHLYLSNRITELPLGIFSVAIYTVLFPLLSKQATRDESTSFNTTFEKGILLITAISLPASLGLILLAEPTTRLLFEWGEFGESDVIEVSRLLIIYSFSILPIALSALLTRAFHATKNMRAPVRVSVIALIVNTLLSLVFMNIWGAAGLAIANTTAAVVHNFLLLYLFKRIRPDFRFLQLIPNLLKLAVISVTMVAATYLLGMHIIEMNVSKAVLAMEVIGVIGVSVMIYLGLFFLLRLNKIYRGLR